MSGRRGIVDSPYPRGCRRRRCYLTLAQIIALFAQVGYCQRIGEIDNQRGEIRAIYKYDVSSFHLSLGIRVSCMGTDNHWDEHHGYDQYHQHHEYNHRYDNRDDHYRHHPNDGHYHRFRGHYDRCHYLTHRNDGHHHKHDNGNDGHHHGYDDGNYHYHW